MPRELMLERIRKAQQETDQKKELIRNGRMRQHFHFMPQTGWLNDPNGLIWFRGKYHYFYQHNPYYGMWDSMHWGHAVSEDLLHWEYLPVALAPSEPYDDYLRGGCFSGSAVEHDGRLFLIYTGTAYHADGLEQSQCVAFSEDGVHFEKYEGNPVLRAPEGIRKRNFRDPRVWKHGDRYYLVCAADCGGRGQALLYRSEDLLHWTYVNVLAESRGEWGYMWECPDFYRLGDKYVLTFSPMGAGDHTAVYFVGDFDYDTGTFDCQRAGEMDWGMDFYAPQSFEAPDGRRIVTAWANEVAAAPFWKDSGPTYREGWCGFFALPREVRLMPDLSLQFVPVRELQTLRTDARRMNRFSVGDEALALTAGDGVSCEIKLKIDLAATNAQQVELFLRCGGGRKTVCTFDFQRMQMSVDRNEADGWSQGISRSALFLKGKRELDVHIFLDQSSVEIFADQYRNNHADNVYAGNEQNQIWIRARGGSAVISGYESYGMKECFR